MSQPNPFISTEEINAANHALECLPKYVTLGTLLADDRRLSKFERPNIACGWYWAFGCVGHHSIHTHLDTIASHGNWFDTLTAAFSPDDFIFKGKDALLWKFCEISRTIYTLCKMAEVCYLGGSHYTTNPSKDVLQDGGMYRNLMLVKIPAQIQELYKVFAEAHAK